MEAEMTVDVPGSALAAVDTRTRLEDYALEGVLGAGACSIVMRATFRPRSNPVQAELGIADIMSASQTQTGLTGTGDSESAHTADRQGEESQAIAKPAEYQPQKRVALKMLIKSRLPAEAVLCDAARGAALPAELFVARHLRARPHACVLGLAGEPFETAQYYGLPLPLHARPSGEAHDLFSLLRDAESCALGMDAMLSIFAQVCHAVAHLHNALGCAHGDVKDENVLVCTACPQREGRPPHVLLADMGAAAYYTRGPAPRAAVPPTLAALRGHVPCRRGTPGYVAPEVAAGRPADGPPQDVWALGALLHLLVHGVLPYASVRALEVGARTRPRAGGRVPREVLGAIEEMLGAEPETRPTASALCALPWVRAAWEDCVSPGGAVSECPVASETLGAAAAHQHCSQ